MHIAIHSHARSGMNQQKSSVPSLPRYHVKAPEYKNLVGSDHVERIRYMSNIKNFIGALYRESCFSPIMVTPGLRVRKTMMDHLNYIFLFDEYQKKPIIACCAVTSTGRIMHGFSLSVNADTQSFYQGEFFNQHHYSLINKHFPCIKDGEGQLFFNDGRFYHGEFAMNFRHGRGIMEWGNKSMSYHGQYVKGLKQGHGVMRFRDANEYYAGAFVQGKKHGQGLYMYADGSHYYGAFQHDQKHGHGRLYLANHPLYVWIDCEWDCNHPKDNKRYKTHDGAVYNQDGEAVPGLPAQLHSFLESTAFCNVFVQFS